MTYSFRVYFKIVKLIYNYVCYAFYFSILIDIFDVLFKRKNTKKNSKWEKNSKKIILYRNVLYLLYLYRTTNRIATIGSLRLHYIKN